MKQWILVLLIIPSFLLMLWGGNSQNVWLCGIGSGLLLLNAGAILLKRKTKK